MKVYRLLDRAKRVIANENKKLQREATLTDKSFQKRKTQVSTAQSKRLQSAGMTGMSEMSIKDRALSKFDNCKYQNELQNVQNQSLTNLDDYAEDLTKW